MFAYKTKTQDPDMRQDEGVNTNSTPYRPTGTESF